jgi:MoxR-like ATPase
MVNQGFKTKLERIKANLNKVVVGKERVFELVLTALLARGHVLLEDVPGVGKTLMAKTLAKSLDLKFRRIQCTPDLLPSDVLGVNVYNQKTSEFEFRSGPIMTNILLADEINRATPKTQSSLLEVMEEGQFTIEGVTRHQEYPFMVIATQNPIEMEGTFPLPEAQLDRFLMRISFGYPTFDEEKEILHRFGKADPLDEIKPVINRRELIKIQSYVNTIYVDEVVENYMLKIVRETRVHPEVSLGASPRASLLFLRCARALAAVRGRAFVIPDDVKALAVPVLSHRILLSSRSFLRNVRSEDVIEEITDKIPVPVENLEEWGN